MIYINNGWKAILTLIIFFAGCNISSAGIPDSLSSLLKQAPNDSARAHIIFNETDKQLGSDFDYSIELGQQALFFATRSKYYKGQAIARCVIGDGYYFKGDLLNGLKWYLSSIKIYEDHNYSKNVAGVNRRISAIYQQQKHFNKAIEYMNKALEIDKKENYKSGLAQDYFRFQTIYGDMKMLDKALEYGFKGLETTEDETVRHTIIINTALVYKDKKDYVNALIYADKAMPFALKTQYNFSLAIIYQLKAVINIAKENYGQAEENIQKAINYFKSAHAFVNIPEFYEELSREYEKNNKYNKALYWLKQQKYVQDSLFNAESEQQINELKIKFESEKQAKEIAQLNQESAKQEARLLFSNQLRNIALVVLLFLIIVSSVIFYNMRRVKKLNRQLKLNELALKESNRVKNKLFSIIAHDLRSPLNTIDAILTMMRRSDVTKAEAKQYAAYLETSLDNTLTLLDNLLNWSINQMDGFDIKIGTVNITGLINENIDLHKEAAANKHISLTSKMPEQTVLAKADVNICRLVLRNIISNAIKFTNAEGEIVVEVLENNDEVEISVKDNGMGMAPEVLRNIFALDSTKVRRGTANEKGTGLGLMLSNELLKNSGGSILAKSVAGRGSILIIKLPIAQHVSALNEAVA